MLSASRRHGIRFASAVMVGMCVGILSDCGLDSDTGRASDVTPSRPGPLAGLGWTVNEGNVGLRALGLSCDELPRYTGPRVVPAGTVISGKRMDHGLDLSAGEIVIEGSCVRPIDSAPGMPIVGTTDYNRMLVAAGKITIRDSEIDGSLLDQKMAAQATGFIGVADLLRNYIHGVGSGIAIMNAGTERAVLVEHNYVTGLVAWGDPAVDGTHSDAFTVRDFDASVTPDRSLVVRNNRFDSDSGADTGAFFVQTYAGPIDNLVAEGNFLEGGGYQLGLNQTNYPYSNVRAVNNRFTGTGWGPAYVQGGPGWTQWEDNHFYDPTGSDAAGDIVAAP